MKEENELEQQDDALVATDAASQEDTDEDASKNTESNENPDDANTSQEDENADEGTGDEENADESDASDDDDDDDEALVPLSKLKKVRNEAKNLRERLKTAEARVEELEAGQSDTALVQERDDLKAEVTRLQSELHTERLSVHLDKAAEDSGAIEPAVVTKLVDTAKIEWGDDGKPTNLDAMITDLKTAYPKLFSTAQGTGNVGNRSEPRGRDEALTPSSRLSQAYSKKK